MFRPGEVVFVVSDQVAGHRWRDKYHVCVSGHQGVYLFINSREWVGSFAITHDEMPALPNPVSHIACNTVLRITDAHMKAHAAKSVGVLSRDVVARLIEHVEACDVMTDEEKELVVDGLSGALT